MQSKQQLQAIVKKDDLFKCILHVGGQTFNNYEFVMTHVKFVTLVEYFATNAACIAEQNAKRIADGLNYLDLTDYDLTQPDELLFVYDIEFNSGRSLTDKELDEYIGSAESPLTPAGLRRWYINRKSEAEFLVSDGNNTATFWIPE